MSGVGRLRVSHEPSGGSQTCAKITTATRHRVERLVRAFGTAGRVSYTVGARETSERVAASDG